jgi:dTMP kinase
LGLFVTLEGVDGAGKSTQARLLADRLRAAGHDVVLTREPGGSPGAEEIRRLLVEGSPGRWSPETEILLFTAVVCDRFVDSTRAYQGHHDLRGAADRLHRLMIGVDPDLTLILDLDAGTGLVRSDGKAARAAPGGPAENRFERRGAAFQAGIRQAFLAIAAAEPRRCRVIDASRPLEAVAESVWQAVGQRLAA